MPGAFFAPSRWAGPDFTIRAYRAGDGPALREATISSYGHLRTFLPWATEEQSEAEAEALARRFLANHLLGADFVMAVVAPDDKTLLGGSGFHLRGGSFDHKTAEIGMWIRASHARKGLGTAVLAAMTAWGFSEWPWLRLSWHCDTRNVGSRRVAERNGYRLEGTLRGVHDDVTGGRRDMAIYGRLRDEG